MNKEWPAQNVFTMPYNLEKILAADSHLSKQWKEKPFVIVEIDGRPYIAEIKRDGDEFWYEYKGKKRGTK
jgi:uncharacterized protein with von Willebrand factor type A (vWA) domain